jgi:hypothetical protein
MGLGETVGTCARLTQNNRGLYAPTGTFAGGVHVALMGDPTLRLHVVAPPSALVRKGTLSWSPSPEPGASYHVYHAAEEHGAFRRLTETPIAETSYSPPSAKGGVYMVRAIKLETGASGSYVNASQGIFAP